jgi:hypothetical protein
MVAQETRRVGWIRRITLAYRLSFVQARGEGRAPRRLQRPCASAKRAPRRGRSGVARSLRLRRQGAARAAGGRVRGGFRRPARVSAAANRRHS